MGTLTLKEAVLGLKITPAGQAPIPGLPGYSSRGAAGYERVFAERYGSSGVFSKNLGVLSKCSVMLSKIPGVLSQDSGVFSRTFGVFYEGSVVLSRTSVMLSKKSGVFSKDSIAFSRTQGNSPVSNLAFLTDPELLPGAQPKGPFEGLRDPLSPLPDP